LQERDRRYYYRHAPYPNLADLQAEADRVVSLPATTGDLVIGMQSAVYLQTDATVHIDYSATGLNVACIQI